jgi:hypothetical protein
MESENMPFMSTCPLYTGWIICTIHSWENEAALNRHGFVT